MAKQKGILKIKGTLGDITFYKSRDGHLVREKGGIDAKRIAKDPAFQRTRENGSEFGRAVRSGSLLRNAFRVVLQRAGDGRMSTRLTQRMMKVIQADAVSIRGERNVIDGEATLLEGFEFNNRASLAGTLFAAYEPSIDRATGLLSVTIPPFIPSSMLHVPEGATHYKLVSAGAVVDFTAGNYSVLSSTTAPLPINSVSTVAVDQSNALEANTTAPLFLIMGVEFYQQMNNAFYSLSNGAFNSFTVVKVDGGV